MEIKAAVQKDNNHEIVFENCEKKTIHFKFIPMLTGLLKIFGIVGKVALSSELNANLKVCLYFKTKELKNLKITSDTTLIDHKLSIQIAPPVPALGVSFTPIPDSLISGEIVPVMISLKNTGVVPITDIYIGTECPRWVYVVDKEFETPLYISENGNLSDEKLVKDKEIRRQHVFRFPKISTTSSLEAKKTATVPIQIQAPYQKGEFKLRLLIYYSIPRKFKSKIKYRLVRHEWLLNVRECLHVEADCAISNFVSNDYALDIQFKNCNQLIFETEIYINSVGLYCSRYKLDDKKVFCKLYVLIENKYLLIVLRFKIPIKWRLHRGK